jgi:hypothetical protein
MPVAVVHRLLKTYHHPSVVVIINNLPYNFIESSQVNMSSSTESTSTPFLVKAGLAKMLKGEKLLQRRFKNASPESDDDDDDDDTE